MSQQDHPSTRAFLRELDLRHADEALVREELVITRQRLVVAAMDRAG
jgi:hypothetical protein